MPLPSPHAAAAVDLSGRVVMVTGASGGLGKPLSLACAARGATVVLHGRVVRKLEAIYDEIVAAGHPQPTILPLDCHGARRRFPTMSRARSARSSAGRRLVRRRVAGSWPVEHQSSTCGRRCCAQLTRRWH
jgi:NAD(P)-dependent dehydrogenase (short-subunit alcohol dehydrogenase family)